MQPQPNPLFCGTLHLVNMTYSFFPGAASTTPLSASLDAADLQTLAKYIQHAIVPITGYASQYGPCALTLSATFLPFTTPTFENATFDDSDVQAWVDSIANTYGLGSDDCVIIPCPNTQTTPLTNSLAESNDWGGYHKVTSKGIPYNFDYIYGSALTLDDGADVYALLVSHEIAEMTVDPKGGNPEVCDPCQSKNGSLGSPGSPGYINCFFADDVWAFAWSLDNWPPSGDYSYFVAGVAVPGADLGSVPGWECEYPAPMDQFSVKPFCPWAGYGIPNGVWLVGDVTGDGKVDIVHAVANTDYVNVWLSNGDGTFDVNPFIPWAGYDISAGLWMVGDVTGDGKSDLVHAVGDTDYVNVWLSNGDGTFDVKPFSPWAGYGIPNGVWLVGDVTGDGKVDIVHAVANTDYVNVWLSNGDGTFDVKPFSPWAGYDISEGSWMVADFTGNGKSDLVHILINASYVNVWLSNGDGTFDVKPFIPFEGADISEGLWLVGDFTGDGKSDILLAVSDSDIVSIWTSNGDGTFDVKHFTPWAGYAIPNGQWLADTFGRNLTFSGVDTIIHAVTDTNYVNVWVSQEDGATFAVNPFVPSCSYGISSGTFIAGDFTGDGRADLVHLITGSDTVRVWLSMVQQVALPT
jgi:FG-GAP-like repeat